MTTLLTFAETAADDARALPNFSKLSLPGIRDQVAQMLHLIGRTETIFSTYSVHDISHVDAMLRLLDWLVPKRTASAMTPLDWLITVLAIYLHDLGMVVTQDEFEKRNENPAFSEWLQNLEQSSEGRDYLARTNRMSEQERDRFFFQEFVRKGHAGRIREWITGHHSRIWGPAVLPIARMVSSLLEPLPVRFRDYLGVVCESHHQDTLSNNDVFPLCARCGNDPAEVVNVQFAGVLLRTADLLHVTKDRTPSVMYETIRLSDPKGVDEWDKQLGTFAVGPKGRGFVEGDRDSAIIVINADFTAERPFFALQEYISYANDQVRQSKRWIDGSESSSDGAGYTFPWHTVKGDVRLEGVPPQPLSFELDRGRLLDLLVGHTIYNDPTVAIRELLQNGIDAVRYQHHLNKEKGKGEGSKLGSVAVEWDPSTRLLSVEDSGVGMTRDVIKFHLMRVGASYYNTPQFETEHRTFNPISRFGIGILTCFMVSDDIEIVTTQGIGGHRIRMTSVHADYLLRDLAAGDEKLRSIEPHGTRVTLRIRDTVDLEKRSVRDIVRHWIILPECAVLYRETGKADEYIGFDSAEQALGAFQETAKPPVRPTWALRLVTKNRQETSDPALPPAVYELAFAVYEREFAPEKDFATQPEKKDFPAVCIEGIRVSGQLPWFRGNTNDRALSVLLSVRGDRRFRTTVSRAGLENDEEYERVGRLCADLLFDHVRDEVARLSQKPGAPLSQAATAAFWLFGKLHRNSAEEKASQHLQELFNAFPAVVFETSDEGERISRRSLVSFRYLLDQGSFWTVESRLVDSLGTMSRDLGKEVSLNQFLAALAPEFTTLHYTPLVPDASLYRSEIVRSCCVTAVEFSRRHQQSATQWCSRADGSEMGGVDLEELSSPGVANRLIRDFEGAFSYGSLFYRRSANRVVLSGKRLHVNCAPITGDDDSITGVSTRLGLILKIDTEPANVWLGLREALTKTAVPDDDYGRFAIIYRTAQMYLNVLTTEITSGSYDVGTWRGSADAAQKILDELRIAVQLPVDIVSFSRGNVIFNASNYWRNWTESS